MTLTQFTIKAGRCFGHLISTSLINKPIPVVVKNLKRLKENLKICAFVSGAIYRGIPHNKTKWLATVFGLTIIHPLHNAPKGESTLNCYSIVQSYGVLFYGVLREKENIKNGKTGVAWQVNDSFVLCSLIEIPQ